jgi:hypothetical protein
MKEFRISAAQASRIMEMLFAGEDNFCPYHRIVSYQGKVYTRCKGGECAEGCEYRGKVSVVDVSDFVYSFDICKNRGMNPDKEQEDIFG